MVPIALRQNEAAKGGKIKNFLKGATFFYFQKCSNVKLTLRFDGGSTEG